MQRHQNCTQYSKCGPAEWHNHIPWSAGNNLCWCSSSFLSLPRRCRHVLRFLDGFDSLSFTLWILALDKQQASKAQLGRQLGARVPHRSSPIHQHALLLPTGFDLLSGTYGSTCDFEWNLFVLPAYCQDFTWFFHLWVFCFRVFFSQMREELLVCCHGSPGCIILQVAALPVLFFASGHPVFCLHLKTSVLALAVLLPASFCFPVHLPWCSRTSWPLPAALRPHALFALMPLKH